jgi:hypothetical protein
VNSFLAKVISVLFHPLLMTTYVFIGLILALPYSLNLNMDLSVRFISMVLVTTFVIPFIGVVLLKFTRTISNLEMDDRKERFFPFLFISLFYLATTYLFYTKFRFPPIISYILLGVSSSLIVLTLITLFWKISAHAIAVGGAVGIFAALLTNSETNAVLWLLSLFVLIAGLVGTARLRLNAHDNKQVWLGYLLGFCLNFTIVSFLN